MENTINLNFISNLAKNMDQPGALVQVVLGPRQVGKTTSILKYLKEHHPTSHHYVSADLILHASTEWIMEQWDFAQRNNFLLVIDEIQKCQNWSEVIKKLWDDSKRTNRPVNCILLGSSSLAIQKGLSESLTGRFQLVRAFHWNAAESLQGYQLSFDEFIKFGGYPGSYVFKEKSDWKSFVEVSILSTVLEKDILQYHTVKNPALFKQAFEIIMAYPAREISYTKLLGQLQSKGNVELIKYYLDLYQGAFLIKVLEKYSPSQLRIKGSSPKIIPLAPCLYYLTHLDDYTDDERGRVFEALVGSQLIRTGESVYYWRNGKFEVDFVVKRGKKIYAIEVKNTREKSTIGMAEFMKQFPNAKRVFITQENYFEFERDPMKFLER